MMVALGCGFLKNQPQQKQLIWWVSIGSLSPFKVFQLQIGSLFFIVWKISLVVV